MLGRSQERMVMGASALLMAASCVPASGINPAGSAEVFAASITVKAPPTELAALTDLAAGKPYHQFEAAVTPALPFSAEPGSDADRERSLDCLSKAIYYEARSESEDGQRAVAQVVLNRVRHAAFPNTVCGVVYQGAHLRTGCQFTFTCDGSLRSGPRLGPWTRARSVADDALSGQVYAPVGTATHYHTTAILPYWANSLTRSAIVGAHIFYRWRGRQGMPSAFRQAYAGMEPGIAAPVRGYEPVPVTLASADEAVAGVRRWRGSNENVRVHRGAPPAEVASAAAEPELEAGADFGVQVHRGAVPAS